MSNKIETVSIGDLPIATELDDADELLLRDVSATLPENATARLSIATLRAAMGGGSPDRIESESGAAFAEATDDFLGMGTSAVLSRTNHSSGSAIAYTAILPGEGGPSHPVLMANIAATNADETQSAGIGVQYDPTTEEFRLRATGAPLQVDEPIASNHAATKGYVDSRPGAEEWSEHAATQDVDLDGHKLTGLGAPTEENDAATKGYVDSASPTKIERTFSWGRSVAEVTDDGNVELAVYLTGETAPLRRVRVISGNTSGGILMMNRSGMGPNDWQTDLVLSTVSPSFHFALSGGPSGGATARGGVSFNQGVWRFTERGSAEAPLGSEGYYTLPSGVSSIKHGIHLAKEAYDTLASMPAPPELEWWEPVWTPVENVDSVSNVECSYTRTYRAAGGSLVTLEGTITVEINEDDANTVLYAPLPVPATSTGMLPAPAIGVASGQFEVRAVVTDTGSGSALAISAGELSNATGAPATLTIGFRASYRAA